MNWCRGVVDLIVEEEFISSPRVVGVCKSFEAKAPAPRRAPALTVAEVMFIERLAASGDNAQDVAIVGAVLFMLFASARASDAARAVSLLVDFSDGKRRHRVGRVFCAEEQNGPWSTQPPLVAFGNLYPKPIYFL